MENNKMVELTNLVNTFGDNNENLKKLKKLCEGQNAEIKAIMVAENMNTFSTDQFNASYVIKESVVVDEDKVADILIEDWIAKHGLDSYKAGECPYITMIPKVDQTILESAIYAGDLDPEVLEQIKACSTTKQTPTLTVKKKGGK